MKMLRDVRVMTRKLAKIQRVVSARSKLSSFIISEMTQLMTNRSASLKARGHFRRKRVPTTPKLKASKKNIDPWRKLNVEIRWRTLKW